MSQTLAPRAEKPWCWEGNVVCALASYLIENGWTIESIADTATGQAGADIKASRHDEILIVEVKGYPSKEYERGEKMGQPKRANPATQARHWFGEALLTALLRQREYPAHQVALAFPDFAVYTKLLTRLSEPLKTLQLRTFVVGESGSVVVFSG